MCRDGKYVVASILTKYSCMGDQVGSGNQWPMATEGGLPAVVVGTKD